MGVFVLPTATSRQRKTGIDRKGRLLEMSKLHQAAIEAKSSDDFIRTIQGDFSERYLLDALYDWENSTPENKVRFKNTGWFGIASAFWHESQSVHKGNEANTTPLKQKAAVNHDSLSFTESFSQWLDERGDGLPDEAFSDRLTQTEDSI